METFNCKNGCCDIHTKPYKNTSKNTKTGNRTYKAGVMIYDPSNDSVLLVQSRGNLWGHPKGSMENHETYIECALREVKEETGLKLTHIDLTGHVKFNSKVMYFYHERKSGFVEVQPDINGEANDANGITWIKMGCLMDCVLSGKISLSYQARRILYKVKRITYPKLYWSTVRSKPKTISRRRTRVS
jgi:ADP-ribose pyrophosphatase YjhB (NUDIX family)